MRKFSFFSHAFLIISCYAGGREGLKRHLSVCVSLDRTRHVAPETTTGKTDYDAENTFMAETRTILAEHPARLSQIKSVG
jgi:hypothetical protein